MNQRQQQQAGRLTRRDAAILEGLLEADGKVDPAWFLQRMPQGASRGALRGRRNRLVARGLVDRINTHYFGNTGWRYWITDAGIEALERHYDAAA